MRLRLNHSVAAVATLLTYLLVPTTGLAATTTTTVTKTTTSNAGGIVHQVVELCGHHRTISALGLFGLLVLSFAITGQVAIAWANGIHGTWRRRGLAAAVLIADAGGVLLLVFSSHMGILALSGFVVWTIGMTSLYFLGFGRLARILPHSANEPSQMTNLRRIWNTAFTIGTVIGLTAGPAMIFAGGVHFTWS